MASEQTFADRAGRATIMSQTVGGFPVAFAPGDSELLPITFDVYIQQCNDKNSLIGSQLQTYSTNAGLRFGHTNGIKVLTRRAKDFVLSMVSLKPFQKTISSQSSKITRAPTKKKTVPPPGTPEKAKRNQGELSYADIVNNFKVLITLLTDIGAPYAPPSTELQVANLTTSRTQLETYNTTLGNLTGQIKVGQGERLIMFNGANGLKDKMKAIKKAVKSQYGGSSPEYNSVRLIKP